MAVDYRHVFPFGVFVDCAGTIDMRNVGSTGNTTYNMNQNSGALAMINHPDVGLRACGFNAVFWNNQYPFFQEGAVAQLMDTVESQTRGGKLWQICSPFSSGTSNASEGWGPQWFQVAYDAEYHTEALADTIAQQYAPIYAGRTSILGFNMWDDVDGDDPRGWMAALAMQRATGIPSFAMWTNNGFPEQMGDEQLALTTYRYPFSKYANLEDVMEGDLRAPAFAAYGGRWIDAIRFYMDSRTTDAPVWWVMQGHNTIDDPVTANELRYPTPREIRLMTWVMLGEGAKGLFWFSYTDQAPASDGLGNPASSARMAAIAEMSKRLTPKMRQALLDSEKVADLFTTTGGGSTGRPVNETSAYVATKYDAKSDTYYCIVCNNGLVDATVTINSATLTGKLINMETGDTIKIGGTVDLPPLDGGMWRYDPAYGVPEWDVDYSVDVDTWWSTHWMNPVSPNYLAPEDVKTWPNEVVVAPGELAAAIAAAPDKTTFRLQDGGIHDYIPVISTREHLHFIADDPLNPPTLRGFEKIIGSEYFRWYNGTAEPTLGAVAYHLFDRVGAFGNKNGTPGAIRAHRNPKKDFFFRDLIFDGTGFVVSEQYEAMFSQAIPTGYWAVDHHAEHVAIFFRNCRDILVQNCTFSNYRWGDAPHTESNTNYVGPLPTYPDPVTPSSLTGNPQGWHPGMIGGNSGITNFCSRNNTFNGSSDSRGDIAGIFIDGSRGMVSVDDTFTGRFHQSQILLLTNDDYTGDSERKGWFQQDHDMRNARYNVIINPTLSSVIGSPAIAVTGQDTLIDGPVMTGLNHTLPHFIHLVARCSRVWFLGMVYRNYGNIVRNAVLSGTGTIQQFVMMEPDGGTGDNCTGTPPTPNPWEGRLGRTTVEDNNVGGITVTEWIGNKAGSVSSTDGPDTINNNTDATGTRNGP